jgi:protein TonB
MFDLITGKATHAPRPHVGPVVFSMVVHAAAVGAVIAGTVLFISPPIPRDRIMMAFVAPAPPPPPPPPPAPAPEPPVERKADRPVPTAGSSVPIEVPSAIEPESPADDGGEAELAGVPGGVPGGIAGGVIGGLAEAPPPPPPPPAPPAPRAPIRVGGSIKEPTLIHRVEPEYPALAVHSRMEGVVILEAIVDEEGRVESVRVLRSPGVFDQAALKAVRQWRYSPVLLNGKPEKFILTVVVSFNLT